MKGLKAGLLGALALTGFAGVAQAGDNPWGPFTGGVSLTSDYRFRGVSQSSRDAAVQGWVQYDHASGFFANIWASTIDFDDASTYDSSVEVDLTAGYNFKIDANTTGVGKVLYYWYPGSDAPSGFGHYEYWELQGEIDHSFGDIATSLNVAYSPDYFGETGDAWALTGGASKPMMDSFLFFTGGLDASVHAGYQWIDQGTDYFFYDIGATAKWEDFAFDVRWVDTDLNKAECFATSNCQGGIVLSLTAALPGE
jgi:uncharacterized protein (TIGR02001 family)